jgi:glutamate-1-semialdehyde 2,1-aminomutase
MIDRLSAADDRSIQELRQLLPGGYGRSTFAVGENVPYVVRGHGYELEVADGRTLLDFNNNFASLVHGHAHPAIVAAATDAVANGPSYGLPNVAELAHASALLGRLTGMDQVRYANSGTEAVMTALRVARAHTGRDLCVFVENAYHGTSDAALVPGGNRARRGIPSGVLNDVQILRINDLDELESVFRAAGDSVAALVLDMMPNRAGLVALLDDYATRAEQLCREHGALLIVDEVIGLRQEWGGLVSRYEIAPDLITAGKFIGGGFPVGAVTGRAAVMDELNPLRMDGLEHGGTFSANPVSMAAGLVSMELLGKDELIRINALGARMRQTLAALLDPDVWEVRGTGSLFRLHPSPDGPLPADWAKRLWHTAIERELLLTPNGLAALSTPMDEAIVDDAAERLVEAARAVQGG